MAKRELDALSVGQIRVTLFTTQPFSQPTQTWWSRLFQYPPEMTAAQPQARAFEEAGAFHVGGRLIIKAQGPRVDLNVIPSGTPQPGFSTIGKVDRTVPAFVDVARRFVESCQPPDVLRAAFGLVLGHDEESNEQAVAAIAEYIPELHLTQPANARDLMFQINRPRESQTVSGLRINRLAKWAALETQLIAFGPTGVQSVTGGVVSQIELDINTDGARTAPIPKAQLPPLISEMSEIAKELAAEGDIA